MNDQYLGSVRDTKFLGLILDDQLKFKKHIEYISGKVSKSIGLLFRIRAEVPLYCLKTLYFSLIHPYFLYCLPIFGATYATHLDSIKLLQKRAVRILNNANFFDHTNPLFFKSKILKLDDLYKHSIACYIYRNPGVLDRFSRTHQYDTRDRHSLLPPFVRLRTTQQSFYYNATMIWNEIPIDIKQSLSLGCFKNRYKEFLIAKYEIIQNL